MTVRELIELLLEMPQEAEVLVHPYDGAAMIHASTVDQFQEGKDWDGKDLTGKVYVE